MVIRTIVSIIVIAVATAIAVPARAEPVVVASIKPIHSLVAGVMKGVGSPVLLVPGSSSPHSYVLKPSQAVMLERADLVFWIGEALETFLAKPISTIATHAVSIELETSGVVRLAVREGATFERHVHDDDEDHHRHETHKGAHAEDDDDDHHGHEAHKGAHAEDDDDDHHGHESIDPHVWLDPENAKAFVQVIKDTLVRLDPTNAVSYQANFEAVTAELDALTEEVGAMLRPVAGKPFVVFHDAYLYFERRFGVTAVGAISVSPEAKPSAERIREIRSKVSELGAVCVFSEPQFETRLVSIVMEGEKAKSGVLDPLGAGLEPGPGFYSELIRGMAVSIRNCLSEAS